MRAAPCLSSHLVDSNAAVVLEVREERHAVEELILARTRQHETAPRAGAQDAKDLLLVGAMEADDGDVVDQHMIEAAGSKSIVEGTGAEKDAQIVLRIAKPPRKERKAASQEAGRSKGERNIERMGVAGAASGRLCGSRCI